MSELYTIYQHPERGDWGFARAAGGQKVRTAAVERAGRLRIVDVHPVRLGAMLQDKVRSGFKQLPQPKYLHVAGEGDALQGEFVTEHPDLRVVHLHGERIFFVAIPSNGDVGELVASWRQALDDAPGPAEHEREAWLQHCSRATQYVPALSNDPSAALVVAQWAKSGGHPMVAGEICLPTGAPEKQRYEWRAYLANWMKADLVAEALAHLGWPLHEVLAVTPAPVTTTESAEDWFQTSQQCSF